MTKGKKGRPSKSHEECKKIISNLRSKLWRRERRIEELETQIEDMDKPAAIERRDAKIAELETIIKDLKLVKAIEDAVDAVEGENTQPDELRDRTDAEVVEELQSTNDDLEMTNNWQEVQISNLREKLTEAEIRLDEARRISQQAFVSIHAA